MEIDDVEWRRGTVVLGWKILLRMTGGNSLAVNGMLRKFE